MGWPVRQSSLQPVMMMVIDGIGTVMGLNDLAQTGGLLPAAPLKLTPSGSAQSGPYAGQEAAGELERGTGLGDVAAGEQSQDEPVVSGDDDAGLPATQVAALLAKTLAPGQDRAGGAHGRTPARTVTQVLDAVPLVSVALSIMAIVSSSLKLLPTGRVHFR